MDYEERAFFDRLFRQGHLGHLTADEALKKINLCQNCGDILPEGHIIYRDRCVTCAQMDAEDRWERNNRTYDCDPWDEEEEDS